MPSSNRAVVSTSLIPRNLAKSTCLLGDAIARTHRLRHAVMTPALSEELTYCQGLTQQPLLDKLRALRAALPAAATNADALRPLMAGIRLVCRIFYSLNSLGLTDVRAEAMTHPHACLAVGQRKLSESMPPKSPCKSKIHWLMIDLRAAHRNIRH